MHIGEMCVNVAKALDEGVSGLYARLYNMQLDY